MFLLLPYLELGAVLAFSDDVNVALITTLGVVTVAVVGAVGAVFAARVGREAKATRNELAERVGTPNGMGNVVQMLESVIHTQGRHEERFDQGDRVFAELKEGQKDQKALLALVLTHLGIHDDQ